MLTRRLVASACALCLVVPAAASAKPVYIAHAHHAVLVTTGDTKGDLPGAVPAVPPGDTKDDLPSTPASHNTAVAPRATSQSTASSHDATNGWRLAAVIEGGLLAAFAIGAAVFMTGRQHRAPRMGV
jgi:subtilisin family serine protease